MAGQREDDEVMRDIEAAFEPVSKLRPSHRIVSMWSDLQACLDNIRKVEFLLGYLPEKPPLDLSPHPATLGTHDPDRCAPCRIFLTEDFVDHEAVQLQLQDARMVLGQLALALSDEAENA